MDYELAGLEEESIRSGINNLFYNNHLIQGNLFWKQDLKESLDGIFLKIKEGNLLYQRWSKKINGKERKLSVPSKPLRKFLDFYLIDFIKKREIHKGCHGGEKGWNPKSSLASHLPCSCAFSFDFRSAFENMDYRKVHDFFYRNLEGVFERDVVVDFLSFLCTVKYSGGKRGLPQGSPVSMALFNRILFSLDNKLNQKSKERGFKYSRWVDDITITSSKYEGIESFLGALELTERYFPIAKEKVFFQDTDKIYLLGHKIQDNKVLKNSSEERLKEKCSPLDYEKFFRNKDYGLWD